MDEFPKENVEEETIHIDIQDTVSSIKDNKLVYTASTQGPSFADLFADVETNGGGITENVDVPPRTDADNADKGGDNSKLPRKETNSIFGAKYVLNSATNTEANHSETHNGNNLAQKVDKECDSNGTPQTTTTVPEQNLKETALTPHSQGEQTAELNIGKTNSMGDTKIPIDETTKCNDDTKVSDHQELDEESIQLSDLLRDQASNAKNTDDDDDFDFESPLKAIREDLPGAADTPEQVVKQVISQNSTDVHRETGDSKPSQVISTTHSQVISPQDDTAEIEDEWATVQTITPGTGETETTRPPASKVISYMEALQAYRDSHLDQFKDEISRSVPRSGFKRLKHALFGPPKLHKNIGKERDFYLEMTKYSFDNQSSDHCRLLQTLNKRLTGAQFDCPRMGNHWQHIGFQGNDPSTDLRGCGMLGLLQLIYITTTPKYLPLTREIFKLSLHEEQSFPFCIMGINLSRMCMQALREDCLNRELNSHCKDEAEMLTYMMQYYMATFYRLYTIWKSQYKTIADTGFVLQDLETYVKKNPARLLADLEKRVSTNQQPSSALMTSEAAGEPALEFTRFSDE